MLMKFFWRKHSKWKTDSHWNMHRCKSYGRINKVQSQCPSSLYNFKPRCEALINSETSISNAVSKILACCSSEIERKNNNVDKESFDTDSKEIGIDNRTSYTMSGFINDFVGPIEPTSNYSVRGISGTRVAVNGIGTIKWRVMDDEGREHDFVIPRSLYIKSFRGRLLSPQHWSQNANDNYPKKDGTICVTTSNKLFLKWEQLRYTKTVPIDQINNCFSMRTVSGVNKFQKFQSLLGSKNKLITEACFVCHSMMEGNHDTAKDGDSEDISMADGQENKIDEKGSDGDAFVNVEHLHVSEGENRVVDTEDADVPAATLQAELLRWHYRLGHLSFRKLKVMATLGIIPRKLAQIKPPICAGCLYGGMTRKPWRSKPKKEGNRKIFQAFRPGQCVSVDQMESTTPGFIAQLKGKITKQRYTAATVFVDHYSDMVYVHLQRTLSSNETVEGKNAFEAFARKNGVRIEHYHADNGRFADNLFKQDLAEKGQTISYSGVGAHFQNGRAEKKIRDLREASRKMLIHAMARWPQAIIVNLWPYALRAAADNQNLIPVDVDGRSKMETFTGVQIGARLKSFHTWGCPVYALHSKLQGGSAGISKWSPRARLGINLGFSPRHARSVYLVLSLSTGLVSPQYHVSHDDFFETVRSAEENTFLSNWQSLTGFQRVKSFKVNNDSVTNRRSDDATHATTDASPDVQSNEEAPSGALPPAESIDAQRENRLGSFLRKDGVRRSARLASPQLLMEEVMTEEDGYEEYYLACHEDDYKIQDEMADPIAFKATSDPDTMYWHQAMAQPDADKFLEAAAKEFNSHFENKHWTMIERSQVPKHRNVLPAVWAMKRKRDIMTRAVKKYKARLNLHGGKQVFGEDFYETYSPVVGWITVRFLLILSLICKWHTRQVDFTLAYPQAEIEQPMYMELPKGVISKDPKKDYVLELHKNLYGQKQAGRVWNEHLKDGLQKIGFSQSKVDECLFFRGTTMFAVYVDDGIFIDRDKNKIDKAIKDMSAAGYGIEDMGKLTDYLGVNFEYEREKIHLKQPHLIDQIIKDVGIMKKKFKSPTIPAKSTCILQRYKDAQGFDKRWHYRSVIGKLNYLEKCTRPDIAYAVHQCARFCEEPKEEHARAVEFLVRYLAGTKDKGITLTPNGVPVIDIYADADFAGNWNKMTAEYDPSTAKSRSGYIINFAGCPIHWVSKLQTQIALSTTEAEYIALSQSLREGIPVMHLVNELREKRIVNIDDKAKVYCRCFEDNAGALELASSPKLRPRTKHINLVYHHFRSYAREGLVKIYSITSKEQICDIMTKPLPQNQFQYLRRKFMYW